MIDDSLKIDTKELRSDFIPAIEGLSPGEQPPAVTPPAPVTPAVQIPTETPVTPPASVKPENTEPPVIPAQADLSKVHNETLKAIFGDDIEDVDQAKAYLENLKKVPEPVDPFANSYVKGLNDYLKGNPTGTKEIYDKIISIDVKSLDNLQAIKTTLLWEHPELSETQVDLLLKREFRQSDEFDDDEDKQLGAVNLTIRGNDAKKKLSELQERHKLPDTEKVQAEAADKEKVRIESLKPVVKELVEGLNELELDLGENPEKESRGTFKFSIADPEFKKELRKEMNDIAQYSGLTNSKEDREILKGAAIDRVVAKRYKELVKAACEHTESITAEKLRKKYSNAAPPASQESLPPAKTGATGADTLYNKIMGGQG